MANKTWKGYLNFGLLSIPVYLNVGARSESISMNMLHEKCKGRISMPRKCENCNRPVDSNEIVKGWPVGEDKYVVLTQEEIDNLEPESSKVMEIEACVKASEVDPLYLAESFYLLPEAPGMKAYSLLVKALKDSDRVGIAQLTKSGRENIVLIRPKGNGLMCHYLYYEKEVRKVPEFDSLAAPAVSANEAKLAMKLIESLAAPFAPGKYKNGYEDRLNQLISSKLDKTVAAPTAIKTTAPPVMDVMAALEASLNRPKRAISLRDEEAPKAKKVRKAA